MWERGCCDTGCDKVGMPNVAGPCANSGPVLEEEGGDILGDAVTLLHHLGLQNMQFFRGTKSTWKSEMVCSMEPCCPQKSQIQT